MLPEPQPGEMRAHARLATEATIGWDGQWTSQVSALRAQAPIMPRITGPKEPHPWADQLPAAVRVSVAAGAAGPMGGDELDFDIDVGANSCLVLTDISATLLLPGARGRCSRSSIRVRVADGATLVWLAEPLIAAAHCNHVNDVDVALAPTARLLLREELILGRHGEQPGTIRQRLLIRRDGQPLYHQDLHIGADAPGWNSAAVAAGHRAVGSILLVDPQRDWTTQRSSMMCPSAGLLPLAGPAALVSALADDSLALRRALTAGLDELGTPWQSDDVPTEEEPHSA